MAPPDSTTTGPVSAPVAEASRTGLVRPTGRLSAATGGRPAELYRVADGDLSAGEALGLPLPALR